MLILGIPQPVLTLNPKSHPAKSRNRKNLLRTLIEVSRKIWKCQLTTRVEGKSFRMYNICFPDTIASKLRRWAGNKALYFTAIACSAKTSIAPCKGIRIPEFGKTLVVESGILDFGIRNTAQGILNSTNDWNPESKFHRSRIQYLESGIQGLESRIEDSLVK